MVRRFVIFTLNALVILAALGGTVLGGTVVAAQGPGPGGPRGRGPGGPRAGLALRALDLTDAQREQVRQLTQQHRQTRALVERAKAGREAQRQAVEAIPFSEEQIRAAMQALAEAQAELAVQQARLQSDIYALLTPEQQQRLQKMREEREGRAKGRRAGLALRALDLTDAQREQVRQLTQQHREQTRALVERAKAGREAQRQAVEAIPFSEEQIRAAMQALAEAQAELAVQQARLQSDIYALLTPEQQQRLQKMREEREGRAKGRRDRFQQRLQGRPRPSA